MRSFLLCLLSSFFSSFHQHRACCGNLTCTGREGHPFCSLSGFIRRHQIVFISGSLVLTLGRHDSLGESFYFGFVFAFSLHISVAHFHCALSFRTLVAHFFSSLWLLLCCSHVPQIEEDGVLCRSEMEGIDWPCPRMEVGRTTCWFMLFRCLDCTFECFQPSSGHRVNSTSYGWRHGVTHGVVFVLFSIFIFFFF